MPIAYSKRVITQDEVDRIVVMEENWLLDMKGKDIKPAKLSRTVSAFANTNGGEIYLGISRSETKTAYYWDGLSDEEAFNPYTSLLDEVLPSYEAYAIEAYL